MSWLGNNGFSRESMKALGEAYSQMNENRFAAHGGKDTDAGAAYAKPSKGGNKKGVYTMKGKDGKPLFNKEDAELDELIEDEYEVSFEDGCQLDEGKKKCKEGYKWDSDKGKCVKKKKKSSSKSSKTTIIVKGRGGGMYGPGYIHGHGGSNGGGDNGGEGETESGGDGGDGGGGE